MKVTIELELSPSEAREMFGQPDLSELYTSITSELLKKCEQDPQIAFDTFIKPSMDSGLTGFNAYQKMMAGFLKSNVGKAGKG